jgi:hypothetical protein
MCDSNLQNVITSCLRVLQIWSIFIPTRDNTFNTTVQFSSQLLAKSLLVNGPDCSGQTPADNEIWKPSRMVSHHIPCLISLSLGL